MRPSVRMAVYFVTVAMGRGSVRHVAERSDEEVSVARHPPPRDVLGRWGLLSGSAGSGTERWGYAPWMGGRARQT